ncbi:MAG TPA: YjfB family protein [Candidatus Paceibacterota bacterium]|nr:YjfB family protein [Candidatus Paceibacterota bacterium]
MKRRMNISGQSPTSLLDSVLNAQTTGTEIGVTMLKKAQDVEKQQGAALIDMLEKSAPQLQDGHLDVYA